MYKKLKILALVAAGLLVATIVVQNTEYVETRVLFFTLSMPRAALLAGTGLIGFALGVVFASRLVRRGQPRPK